jgi:hypothetical protein
VLALVLVNHLLAMFKRPAAAANQRPDARSSLGWLAAWFATAIWCLFGPRYNEATLLPATCMLVLGALPVLLWLSNARFIRWCLLGIVVGVHAIVWPIALVKYHRFGADAEVRMATLEGTPDGQIAFIEPTSQIPADFWFPGEGLGIARQRQLVAIEAFGLRDIVFVQDFRRLDLNPKVALELETDATPDELAKAHVPTIWATEVGAARKQFELFVKRLRGVRKGVSARLALKVPGLDDSRPVYAAWADETGTVIPRTSRSSIDPNAQITVKLYPPDSRKFKDAFIVAENAANVVQYHGGSPVFRPQGMSLHYVVACHATRCLVIDAFIPRF